VDANKVRIQNDPATYKLLRQQLVERPYSTIKRQWGFDHIMTKRTMERAAADVGLIFTAYNLRRLFNLLGNFQITSPLGWRKLCLANSLITLNFILRSWMITLAAFGQKSKINNIVVWTV
jgi:hypothetical protein